MSTLTIKIYNPSQYGYEELTGMIAASLFSRPMIGDTGTIQDDSGEDAGEWEVSE